MQSEHQTEESLHAWLDNELGSRESALIREHVGTCATCSATLAECRETRATVSYLLQGYDRVLESAPVRTGKPRTKISLASAAASAPIIGHIVAGSQPIKLWSAAKHFAPIAAAAVLFVGSATFALMRNYSSLTGSVKNVASEAQLPFVDVSGVVMREDGVPIQNATISFVGVSMRTRSDANGQFKFLHVPRTAQRIVARGIGFAEVSMPFDADKTTGLKIMLVREVLKLDAVKISADSIH